MKIKIILTVILLLNSAVVLADDVKNIRNLYKNIDSLIKEDKSQKALVYLELLEATNGSVWKRVKDSVSKQQFNKSTIKNEVFIYNKKIIKIRQITESKSGDWEDNRELYFRENGRVAFVFQKLITFQAYDPTQEKSFPPGPYILEKRAYYDQNGDEIKLFVRAYVSSTKKDIPVQSVHQINLKEYKSIQELPFLNLLQSEMDRKGDNPIR